MAAVTIDGVYQIVGGGEARLGRGVGSGWRGPRGVQKGGEKEDEENEAESSSHAKIILGFGRLQEIHPDYSFSAKPDVHIA